VFLETGTHRGATAAWASQHFERVVTIEASEGLYRAAVAAYGHLDNVRLVLGDTRSVLPGEVERLDGPAVVWLDSHWSGGESYGEGLECPLLSEIETLRSAEHDQYLFIDDARLFVAPPPRPHNMDQWPGLVQVTEALTRGERPLETLILGHAFVAVPTRARELVRMLAQDAATRAWQESSRPPVLRLGVRRGFALASAPPSAESASAGESHPDRMTPPVNLKAAIRSRLARVVRWFLEVSKEAMDERTPDVVPSVLAPTSVSDAGDYPEFCQRAAQDASLFACFRRDEVYMSILGLDASWGPIYFDAIPPGSAAAGLIPEVAQWDDAIGDPIKVTLPNGVMIAPTTLWYLKVADDLARLFGSFAGADVCEIGVGYGGQCRVLDALFPLRSYTLVDLRPVLSLAERFLSHFPLHCELRLRTMNELAVQAYDLVISNYAFSELAGHIQQAYVRKAVATTPRGTSSSTISDPRSEPA
jgi:hypothetical protein